MQSDYNDLTVVKLKALCKEQNLTISGRKSELIERLIANDNSKYDNEEEMEPEMDDEDEPEMEEEGVIEINGVKYAPVMSEEDDESATSLPDPLRYEQR